MLPELCIMPESLARQPFSFHQLWQFTCYWEHNI